MVVMVTLHPSVATATGHEDPIVCDQNTELSPTLHSEGTAEKERERNLETEDLKDTGCIIHKSILLKYKQERDCVDVCVLNLHLTIFFPLMDSMSRGFLLISLSP